MSKLQDAAVRLYHKMTIEQTSCSLFHLSSNWAPAAIGERTNIDIWNWGLARWKDWPKREYDIRISNYAPSGVTIYSLV